VSSYVLINRGNFHLKLLHRFRDIAVFVVGSYFVAPFSLNVALQLNNTVRPNGREY